MGIINFRGARKEQQVQNHDVDFKVGDYMSKSLITFKPNQSIIEVMQSLLQNDVSGAPVLNDKGDVVGIISEGDCLLHVSDSRYYNMPIGYDKIENLMAKDVEFIDANMNIFDATNRFLMSKKRRFPVIREGKLVGIISQKDILQASLKLRGDHWH